MPAADGVNEKARVVLLAVAPPLTDRMPLANVAVIDVALTATPSTLNVIEPEGVGLGVGLGLGLGLGFDAGVVAVVVGDVGELFPPPQATAANTSVNAQVFANRIPKPRGPYTPKLEHSARAIADRGAR